MSRKILTVLAVMATAFMYTNVAKAEKPVMDGLVSYWTFDEADRDDETLKDVIGNNHGTIKGEAKTVPGKVNEALYFDGLDDYVDCGSDESLKLVKGLTVECWAYWEGGCSPIAGIERSYRIWIYGDDRLYCNLATADHAWPGWTTGYTPPLAEWIHLAMVYDGSNLIAYANGEKLGEDPAKGDVLPANLPFLIGVYLPPRPECTYAGMIDELRVYNRGLSQAEIQQNMDAKFYDVAVGKPDDKLAETWGRIKDSR
jgi:hypothetical protein